MQSRNGDLLPCWASTSDLTHFPAKICGIPCKGHTWYHILTTSFMIMVEGSGISGTLSTVMLGSAPSSGRMSDHAVWTGSRTLLLLGRTPYWRNCDVLCGSARDTQVRYTLSHKDDIAQLTGTTHTHKSVKMEDTHQIFCREC
jgi:hypothetical protein